MNEKIKELAEQAELVWSERNGWWIAYDDSKDLERFAELIRQDEREACAKLCDEEANQSCSDHEAGGMYWCAEAIRARGNHDTKR